MRCAGLLAGLALCALGRPAVGQQPLVPLPQSSRPELMTDPSLLPSGRPTRLPDDVVSSGSSAQVVLNFEYLLLRPRRQASDFAIADPNTDGVVEGPIQSLDAGFRSGFRVGAGYRRSGSPWQIDLSYTWYRATDSLAVNAPAGGLLWATQTRPGIIEVADTATASTRWAHDIVDLRIGRDFCGDSALALSVQAGLRIAHIGQDFSAFYDGINAAQTQVASGFDFVGAGLMFGGEAHWAAWRGFSLFGFGRGGMLLGATTSHLRETDNSGLTVNSDITDRSAVVIPVLEMGLGVAWKYRNWNARAGYEVSNWFQLISTPDFVDDVNRGHLTRRQSNYSVDGFFFHVGYSY
jgi:hypothetical protein